MSLFQLVRRQRANTPLAARATLFVLATLASAALLSWVARRPWARSTPHQLRWGRQRLQLPGDGVGKLFHRRYWVDIERPTITPPALIQRVQSDLHAFAPQLLANFRKVKGHPTVMRAGDEYHITILGPWNGCVRVVEVTATSFTFVTLDGHPEAGQITFSARYQSRRRRILRFEISSWARSRDMLVSLSYQVGKLGQAVQENAWVTFCERVVEASGGRLLGNVQVATEERDGDGKVVPAA